MQGLAEGLSQMIELRDESLFCNLAQDFCAKLVEELEDA
jgi:hypothetical protein